MQFDPTGGSSTGARVSATGARGAITRIALERWQMTVARRSAEARATIPDLELEVEVDAEPLSATCKRSGVSRTAALVRACAIALREHPIANGAYRDGAAELHERINVGVLMAAAGRHLVATVFDADTKPLRTLHRELTELETAAADGTLGAPALGGATFTLWDLEKLGIARAAPLVTPGQAAALAAGTVRQMTRVRDGSVFAASVLTATLASDHRILYGAQAAAFLLSIKRHLEEDAQ